MRFLLHAATFTFFLIGSASILAADAPSVASVAALLEAGQEPVRIVCLGDSLTGVYYHSGGRRAWPDMLAIALKRIYPKAKIDMFNAYECNLWDLLPVMPGVTKPLTADDRHRAELARRIIAGRDVQGIDRAAGDHRPADQIFSEWIQNQAKSQ